MNASRRSGVGGTYAGSVRTEGAGDVDGSPSDGGIDAAGTEPGRGEEGSVAGGRPDGGITAAGAAGAGDDKPEPRPEDAPVDPPSPLPTPSDPLVAEPDDPTGPDPVPNEPPKSFIPRTPAGSEPAGGGVVDGNAPTGGIVGAEDEPSGEPAEAPLEDVPRLGAMDAAPPLGALDDGPKPGVPDVPSPEPPTPSEPEPTELPVPVLPSPPPTPAPTMLPELVPLAPVPVEPVV